MDRFAHLNPMLAKLARKQWPEEGREERITRAEQAWKEAMEIASASKLDPESVKWIVRKASNGSPKILISNTCRGSRLFEVPGVAALPLDAGIFV